MRPVTIPRTEAIALARYERDALRARAAAGGPCAVHWERAARGAHQVLECLRRGDDGVALQLAYGVATLWAAAARCSGIEPPYIPGSAS